MSNREKRGYKFYLLNLDVIIASVCMCALVAATFIGVIARYVLSSPFGWIEEVQAALIVWVIFGAAGAAFRTANHAAIEVFYEMFPRPVRMALNVIILLVTCATILYLGYTAYEYMQLFIRTGRTTSVLHISYVLIFAIVPISCVWQVLNFLLVTFTDYTEKETIEAITADDYRNADELERMEGIK